LVEVEALAREHSAAAIERLVDLMGNSLSDAVRLAAANSILDRALGRPRQAVAASLSGDPRQLSDAQLIDIILASGALVPEQLPAPAAAEKIDAEAA
jgi:hypothetical protein